MLTSYQSVTLLNLVAVERIELSSNAYETSVLTIELYSNNFWLLSTPERIELYETPIHLVNCVTIELYNNKLVSVLRLFYNITLYWLLQKESNFHLMIISRLFYH